MIEHLKPALKLYQQRTDDLPSDLGEIMSFAKVEAREVISSILREQKIFRIFLSRVVGVDEILAAKLVAEIGDVSRFPHYKDLWRYAGLIPTTYCRRCGKIYSRNVSYLYKRLGREPTIDDIKKWLCNCPSPNPIVRSEIKTKGLRSSYNHSLKGVALSVSTSFKALHSRRVQAYYPDLYGLIYSSLTGDGQDEAHIIFKAKRKLAKIFLGHLWYYWSGFEYQPTFYVGDVEVRPPELGDRI